LRPLDAPQGVAADGSDLGAAWRGCCATNPYFFNEEGRKVWFSIAGIPDVTTRHGIRRKTLGTMSKSQIDGRSWNVETELDR